MTKILSKVKGRTPQFKICSLVTLSIHLSIYLCIYSCLSFNLFMHQCICLYLFHLHNLSSYYMIFLLILQIMSLTIYSEKWLFLTAKLKKVFENKCLRQSLSVFGPNMISKKDLQTSKNCNKDKKQKIQQLGHTLRNEEGEKQASAQMAPPGQARRGKLGDGNKKKS